MSVPNREYVARQVDALETILRIAQRAKTDSRLLKPVTGIIGCLFKESEEVENIEPSVCKSLTILGLNVINLLFEYWLKLSPLNAIKHKLILLFQFIHH